MTDIVNAQGAAQPAAREEATGAKAVIRNDQIVISIDVDALPLILSGSIALNAVAGMFKVTEPATFAKEVCHALNNEKEDGTTRVHMMFDSAFNHAIDQGAEGVEEVSEDEFEAEAERLQVEAQAALRAQQPAQGEAFDVEAYVDGYEFRGDDGDFVPNAWQRIMLTDAIHGVLAEIPHPAPSQQPAQSSASVSVWVVYGDDHDYDMMSQWLVGVYFTEAEAKAAADKDRDRYVAEGGAEDSPNYDISETTLNPAPSQQPADDKLREAAEALEPFADQAGAYGPGDPDHSIDWPSFSVGAFRRAAEALAALKAEGRE